MRVLLVSPAIAVDDRASTEQREVVVLGGTGFIGSRIVARLTEARGWSVHPASRERIDLCSVMEVERLAAEVPPGAALVMCAVIRRTVDDSFEAMLRNVEMVNNVVTVFGRPQRAKVVFLSSIDVYGRPPRALPVSESSELRPTTYYGVGKAACELLFDLVDQSIPVTILRLPGTYGVTDGGRSVIGAFLRRISDRQPIRITGDGSVRRDYVHVDDVAAVVERCLTGSHSGVFNVVTGRSVRILDLVHEAGRALDTAPKVELAPDADTAGDVGFDARKLRSTWPDMRFRSVESGIRQYAAEMRV